MKKSYTRPIITADIFVANEYVSACFACLNLNNVKAVYKDVDNDGDYDAGTDTAMRVSHMNDCDTNGTGEAVHNLDDLSNITYAFVFYDKDNYVRAPIIEKAGHNSPQFGDPHSNKS